MPYAKGTRKMFVGMPLLLVPSLPVTRLQTFRKSERLMLCLVIKIPLYDLSALGVLESGVFYVYGILCYDI